MSDHSRPTLRSPTRPRPADATRHTKQQRTETATEAPAATNSTETQPFFTGHRIAAYMLQPSLCATTLKQKELDLTILRSRQYTRLQQPHPSSSTTQDPMRGSYRQNEQGNGAHELRGSVCRLSEEKETLQNAIDWRWVYKDKTPREARSKIVVKWLTSTHLHFCLSSVLKAWRIRLGDVSMAPSVCHPEGTWPAVHYAHWRVACFSFWKKHVAWHVHW